jgi:hypothetical protein
VEHRLQTTIHAARKRAWRLRVSIRSRVHGHDQTNLDPSFRVTRERGKVLSSKLASKVLATVHPSSLLRQPDEESRRREYKHFVADLRVAVKVAKTD